MADANADKGPFVQQTRRLRSRQASDPQRLTPTDQSRAISIPHPSPTHLVNKFSAKKMSAGVALCRFMSAGVVWCHIRIPNDPGPQKTGAKIAQ